MSSGRVLIAGVLLPACVVATVGVLSVIGNNDGIWMWRPDVVTLPEAVVTGNYAEVAAQLERGVDPHVPGDIRPGLIISRPARVTPLQAAVWGRNALMVRLLLDHGVIVGPSALAVLKCMNAENNDQAVKALLDELSPAAPPDCKELDLPR